MVKNKNKFETVLVFVFFTLLVTLMNFNMQSFSCDPIWLFHMMQKVSNGYLLYTDINAIVGPVFYVLGGIVFKIFGANFITFNIFGGVIYGAIAALFYNTVKEINVHENKMINILSILVLYFFTTYIGFANYNSLLVFFIMCAIFVEIRKVKNKGGKYSNFLIGIFLGLAFFTKQTLGGMAVIATGLVSLIDGLIIKKKNPFREILEKAAGFFIALIPIVLLMLGFGNFTDYIDLCFGGIFEFGGNNFSYGGVTYYIAIMSGILLGGFFALKVKKEDTEFLVIILYALSFMLFAYPIINSYHIHIATIFIWFVLVKILNVCLEGGSQGTFKILSIFPLILFVISAYQNMTMNENAVVMTIIKMLLDILLIAGFGASLIKENHVIVSRVAKISFAILMIALSLNYFKNVRENEVPEGLEVYAYAGFETERLNQIANVIKYIETKEEEGYKVYVVSWDASEYMVPMNRNNNKYDLLFNGNLGYKGKEKILEEIKNFENTIILKNKQTFWQEPEEIAKYIKENYTKIDEIENLDVYAK